VGQASRLSYRAQRVDTVSGLRPVHRRDACAIESWISILDSGLG